MGRACFVLLFAYLHILCRSVGSLVSLEIDMTILKPGEGTKKFESGQAIAVAFTHLFCTFSTLSELRSNLNWTVHFPFLIFVTGFSGLTAYGGFFEVCKPQKGEKVFVSAAAGSVGSLVGQYAKLLGCYVVGCAGSPKKVALLKDKLGFDDAFNYKEETDLKSTLKRYFPNGIDIYFDNVGGDMLEAAVANMNAFGRVAACGVISEYTDAGKRAAPDMVDVVYKRITIRGFLARDFMNVFPDFLSQTSDYLRSGKLHALEDISFGLESIPSAFIGLFNGDNVGKKIVKIADD